MTILDYFNIHNKEHLAAFRRLYTTGLWPKEFREEIKFLKFPNGWILEIVSELAIEYIKEKLND